MREHVVLLLVALLSGKSGGEKCVCTSYWECITTGGSPIAFCGQDTNEVCCVQGEIPQDNTLNGEGIASVAQPEQREASNGTLPGEPPPPVRLFGDRKVKPIINTAFQNAIPARRIRIADDNDDKFLGDRSVLDAFPPNLISPPDFIDPLKRRRQQEGTRTTLSSSVSPTPISGRSLSFRARTNIQESTQSQGLPLFPRIAVAFAPLTDSASPTGVQQAFNPGRPIPSLTIPIRTVDNQQSTFSFVDSASPNSPPSESQHDVQRKPKFSFRDTRP